MKILISSVGTATSVNLIKYFKKLNDYIIGTDINPMGYTAGSMMVDKFFTVPYAVDENYISSIVEIIRNNDIELFIPVNDTEVYIVSKEIDQIPCKCIVPDTATIDLLRDKFECSQRMIKSGIDVPSILDCDDMGLVRILRDKVGVGSSGISFFERGIGIKSYDKTTQFIQEKVSGEEYTVDVLSDCDGKPLYIIPRKRIEVKSGVATKVLVDDEKGIIDRVKIILETIKLPGFSNIQFIKDRVGKYWFIEINYRFSGCGAATLATCPGYLDVFKDIVLGKEINTELNHDVRWNSIVTRYYEEFVYNADIS